MDALLALAQKGIAELVELQKQVLSTPAAGGA
jgi:ribonuclease PH